MRMHVQRVDRKTVVIGPCPGCTLWTLEYDRATFDSLGGDDERGGAVELTEAVESALQDHLAECWGLQQLLS